MLCDCFLGSPALPQRKTLSRSGKRALFGEHPRLVILKGRDTKPSGNPPNEGCKTISENICKAENMQGVGGGRGREEKQTKTCARFSSAWINASRESSGPSRLFCTGILLASFIWIFFLQNRFCFQYSMKYVPHYGSLEPEAHMDCGTKIPGWC